MNAAGDGEDDEVELPPMDDGGDADDGLNEDDVELDGVDESDSLDDENADDLDDDALDAVEETSTEDDSEGVGAPLDDGLDLSEEGVGDDEPIGEPDAIDGIDEGPEDRDDGGAEGTLDAPEDDVDESALPELDADADGEGDEGDFASALLEEVELGLPPWDVARWAVVEGAGSSLPCASVGVSNARALALGEVLLVVEEGELAARRLGTASGTRLAMTDELVVLAARGHVLSSRDGGATTTPVAGFRVDEVTAIAVTPGRAWIATDEALARVVEGVVTEARSRGVVAIAASGRELLVLCRDGGELSIERLGRDDEGPRSIVLPAAVRDAIPPARSGTRMVAAGGGAAIAIASDRLVLSRDGARSFEVLALQVRALAFEGDGPDAALLALVAPARGPLALVSIPARGRPTRVAELERVEPGAPVDLAWDASREVAWIATPSGLAAFARARKH
jgi:hypothetical protein